MRMVKYFHEKNLAKFLALDLALARKQFGERI